MANVRRSCQTRAARSFSTLSIRRARKGLRCCCFFPSFFLRLIRFPHRPCVVRFPICTRMGHNIVWIVSNRAVVFTRQDRPPIKYPPLFAPSAGTHKKKEPMCLTNPERSKRVQCVRFDRDLSLSLSLWKSYSHPNISIWELRGFIVAQISI